MNIEAIIFDGEGVVIDTEPIWDEELTEFLRRRGHSYERDRIKPLLTGRSISAGAEVLKQEYELDENLRSIAAERHSIIRELLMREVAFIDGFLPFFDSVRRRYMTCLATAMDIDLLLSVDRKLRLYDLFEDRVFTLRDVDFRSKPDPALFLHAARQIRATAPGCVVIEDSPYGIEAAKRAGMIAIGLATTYDGDKLSHADLIAESYAEIDLDRVAALPWERTAG